MYTVGGFWGGGAIVESDDCGIGHAKQPGRLGQGGAFELQRKALYDTHNAI